MGNANGVDGLSTPTRHATVAVEAEREVTSAEMRTDDGPVALTPTTLVVTGVAPALWMAWVTRLTTKKLNPVTTTTTTNPAMNLKRRFGDHFVTLPSGPQAGIVSEDIRWTASKGASTRRRLSECPSGSRR